MPVASNHTRLPLPRGQSAACARVDQEPVALIRCGRGADVCTGAEAWVHQPPFPQPPQRLLVCIQPLRLVDRVAIPVQTEPRQIVHNPTVRILDHARGVDVLDAQQHTPSRGTRAQPGGERRIRVAQVHATRRRGGQAAGYGGGAHSLTHNSSSNGHSLGTQPSRSIDCCCMSGAGWLTAGQVSSLSRCPRRWPTSWLMTIVR